MKTYILIFALICSKSIFAQMTLDTIYANDKKNVALFFPNPIRQGITGADHFVFTYNREKEQYFGLLQATPGTESNLLTVTKDGKVYSYILKYADKLPKLNYFIPENESIGNERSKEIKQKPEIKPVDEYKSRITYFQKVSEYLLNSKPDRISTKRKKGIKLRLQKMTYNTSEVYLVIEVQNNSGIDFEIDYLNVYRTNGNKKLKASFQRLQQEVIYKYKIPSIIKDKQLKRFVYVLPKFVLGDNEKLQIELQELKGNRSVSLKIKF
ncbi:MAG: conjugative transposon protein TraN [Flavobacteriaceae bacterium]|nr:conjugative transposon protein TraN [Flavobacteriaceae bacterium]